MTVKMMVDDDGSGSDGGGEEEEDSDDKGGAAQAGVPGHLGYRRPPVCTSRGLCPSAFC